MTMQSLSTQIHTTTAPQQRVSLVVGLLLVVLCGVAASVLRWQQLSTWHTQAAQYQADGVPMLTTLDAYYGLRLARQWDEGRFVPGVPAEPRHFSRPTWDAPDAWVPQWEPRALPLLSGLIATAAHLGGLGLDQAAMRLPPLLSSLFMLPLFVVFWRLGAPAAGLMAGLVGTCCPEYLARTGAGWSDTDQLNLFFPWLLAALFIEMGRARGRWALWAWAVAAGLVDWVFSRWYPKPGLTLVLVLVLGLHLRLAGQTWRHLLPAVLLFALAAGPAQLRFAVASLSDFAAHYLWPGADVARSPVALQFASVWATISEVQPLTTVQSLARVLPRPEWAAAGGVVFLVWMARRWRSTLPLLPLLLLGLMALVGSRRFLLYLAPFIGAGWGIAITALLAHALRPLAPQRLAVLSLAGAALVFALVLRPAPAAWQVPAPAVPAPVFQDLKRLAAQLPAGARLWTWWDLGYAIVDATGLGVYHDGAVQFTPQTHLVAVSLARTDPAVLHAIVRYVDQAGNAGLTALARTARDLEDLLVRIDASAPPVTGVPVFVAFTPDMPAKWASIRQLATPRPAVAATPTARPLDMVPLRCSELGSTVLRCDGITVDLAGFTVLRTPANGVAAPGDRRPLRRVVVAADGQLARVQEQGPADGLTLVLSSAGAQVGAIHLMDEAAYQSNFTQMYLLGQVDRSRFEEVFHRPFGTRVFRVLPAVRPGG